MHRFIASNKLRGGFTLVELVVVVLILGILAAVATPHMLGVSDRAEAASIVSNVQTIFAAVELYAAENGHLPADTPNGQTPVALEPFVKTDFFAETTALGGKYDWNGPTTGAPVVGVGIRVSSWSNPSVLRIYAAIEEHADDGATDAGWITTDALGLHFKLDNK